MQLRPRLVCIPSDDTAFADHANALLDQFSAGLAGIPDAEAFAARLGEAYPTAVVRERERLANLWSDGDVVWYVTKRAFASRIRASLDIPAERELVFQVYVQRMPEWQVSVRLRRLKRSPRLRGLEFAASYDFLGRVLEGRMRIVDASPPAAVRVEAEGMGASVWYVSTFRPTPTGTRLEVVGDYVLPTKLIPPTVERLVVERRISGDIERAHAALRELCLREAARPATNVTQQSELAPAPF